MSFKSLLWSVALLVLGCALPSSAASSGTAKPKPPEPTGNRYLFIVENSSAMQKRDESTRQTLFEFINTGLRGRMLPGDTFGVWAFNSQPETRFPMQVWDSATRLDLATRVNLFLKDLGYTKRSNFERVWRDLQAVVASVNELTVILITDGKNKISGTPFDQEINTTYRQLGAELTTKNQPFITAFVLREGHFAAYSVTQPGESLILPPPSEKARVRPSSLARSRPDLDDEELSKPGVTTTPPRRVPSIIVTRESVARENDPIGPNHSSSPSAPAPSTPAAASSVPPAVTGPSPAPTAGVPATPPPISKSSLPSTASAGPLTAISPPTTAVSQAVSLPSTATAASAAAGTPTAPAGSPVPQPAPSAPAQPVSNDPAPATAPASVPAPTASIAPIAPAPTPAPAAPAASKLPAATALPLATQAAQPASVEVQTPPLPNTPTAPSANPSPAVVAAATAAATAAANLAPSTRPQPTAAAAATGQASTSSTKSAPTASMVVHARQPTASPLAAAASAPTVAAAPFKSTEGPGARSRTKLILASVMLVGAMGCFWVHQQRARRARQSSFISRALPRASAAAPQAKR
ncbi:MAG: hypothetical protein JNN07_20255 [Verrucomicrobiales bacterium]|nr:hypothetical protein [Verrucomicrobiales bacterium]